MAVLSGQTGAMGWEPLRKSSGPRRLEEALDQVASGLKAPRVQVLKMVFEAWEDLVGSVMASHSSPARLVDGELVVSVDDPTVGYRNEVLQRRTHRTNQRCCGGGGGHVPDGQGPPSMIGFRRLATGSPVSQTYTQNW